MSQQPSARKWPVPVIVRRDSDPEACLRRASDLLEEGGLKDAAFWTRLAADYIAEKKSGH